VVVVTTDIFTFGVADRSANVQIQLEQYQGKYHAMTNYLLDFQLRNMAELYNVHCVSC